MLPKQVFFRKLKAAGKWFVTRGERGGEKGYLCLVPSTKLHLPICQCYQGLLFKKCYKKNDSTFIKFEFELVIKSSLYITQLSINREE